MNINKTFMENKYVRLIFSIAIMGSAVPSIYLDFTYGTNKPTNSQIYTSGDSIYGDTTSSQDVSGAIYDFRNSYKKKLS
jgi:hypothetical protein